MHRYFFRMAALLLLPLPGLALTGPEQMQLADGLYSRGLYDLAAREYLALTTNVPPPESMDVILFRLAESYRYQGRKPEAAEVYRQLIDQYAESSYREKAQFRRAELFATGGQYLDAISYFRVLLDEKPPDDIAASALYYLGYSQAKMLMTRDAEKAYRRLITEYPKTPFFSHACVGLAELYSQQSGRDDEIRDLLMKAAKKPETPRVGAEAWFQLADLAYRKGDYQHSAEAYEQLLIRYPDSERTAEARLPAAWSFYYAGRYGDALKMADNAIQRVSDEKLADWLYLKANCLRQLKRDPESRAMYKQLIDQYPDNPLRVAAAYECALVAYRDHDFAGAVALTESVTTTNALAIDVKWLLAESYSALKQPDAAMKQYRDIAAQFPSSDRAPLAQYRTARLLQAGGALKDASDLYRAISTQYPTNDLAPASLLASASCRVGLKQYDEAQRDWATLLKAYPDFKEMDDALYWKAQVEMDMGQDAKARTTLEQLLQSYSKSRWLAEAHYLRGALMEKSDEWDVAEFHYRSALARKPDAALARKIQFRRVAVMQRQGKSDDAASLLQGLLATPGRAEIPPELLDWLARHDLEKGKFAEAGEAANALINATSDASWKQIGWYLVGRSRHGANHVEEARQAYEQAMAQQATTREGLEAAVYLGQVALESGQRDEARRCYALAAERATSEDMSDVRAKSYFGLGKVSMAEENWDDATRYFLSVSVLFDDPVLTPEAMTLAAQALEHSGKTAQRDDVLKELAERYPDRAAVQKKSP